MNPPRPRSASRQAPSLADSLRAAGQRLWRWVPISPLDEDHRPLIEQHLLALSERDRYLRFGYPATDERIRQHVRALDFVNHELFGIFNRRLELVATAHLAYADDQRSMAEFAVSVLPGTRGRGYGRRLFDHAVRHCRNRRADRMFIHALSENTPMLRMARSAGARVETAGPESEAWLQLPPDSVSSHMEELVDTRAALLNQKAKLTAALLRHSLHLLSEVKTQLGRRRGIASH
ncbi:MAG: GNAT family N-acetyltransferase [Burkholderiales bacterium]|jgi:GNAT superfamily N-acetyltransferase|nr:GNAT family N-acetyltransferase [Burkholderiales bacterium]MBP7519363.1 GNAT family N-acetyltransferase [Leptothrix sp. (in: b-proteobacteria)]HQY07799.1 GNAT family N-acetyltransferase [Burkholderiaceae bacterium]